MNGRPVVMCAISTLFDASAPPKENSVVSLNDVETRPRNARPKDATRARQNAVYPQNSVQTDSNLAFPLIARSAQ